MKGLLLLVPVLSCAFALAAYFFNGSLWSILGAFFIAGPGVAVLLGLILTRRSGDADDIKPDIDRKG